jgi:hypothetical protein
MTLVQGHAHFSQLFDRVTAACAQAQLLAARSTETAARARAARATARQMRTLATETRDAWANADRYFTTMRHQVEKVAIRMREEGMDEHAAAAAMRAHVRFVLYDGGLREMDVEPVVERTSAWVAALYEAA